MLLALVVPVTIIYTYFHWQEQILEATVAQRIKANIGHEHLVTLGFSLRDASNLRWEHEHEFEYQGMMYDVMDRYTAGDSIYYHCWPDHEESLLKKNLYRSLALDFGENPGRKSQESRIFSFFKSLIDSRPCETLIQLEDLADSTVLEESKEHYKNLFISPPTPPPRLA
ncbi:MAG: hypothetical protein IPL46_26610 [Saprospiraceae bacterium]|nr:hypothetical protein [Saprospiraceae bacterium]